MGLNRSKSTFLLAVISQNPHVVHTQSTGRKMRACCHGNTHKASCFYFCNQSITRQVQDGRIVFRLIVLFRRGGIIRTLDFSNVGGDETTYGKRLR